jgi:WD40 repeat protein
MSEPARVFISYGHKDGSRLASLLSDDLTSRGYQVWLDRLRLKGGTNWSREIERELDDADVVVALLSAASFESEVCRGEQLRSLRHNKRVIPVIVHAGAEIPVYLEARQYCDFSENGLYSLSLQGLIDSIEGRTGATLAPAYQRTRYDTVPPLPMNFVPRPEAFETLRQLALSDRDRRHVALIALKGMGGIGKTVLAQALCFDPAVQAAFPDGIVWVKVGENPTDADLVNQMREAAKALGVSAEGFDTLEGSEKLLRGLLKSKAALLVVDDVWRSDDVYRFQPADALRCRVLITTRNSEVASATGALEQVLDTLGELESRSLLATYANTRVEDLPPEAAGILQECRGLALALAMIGATLRGEPHARWADIKDSLQSADLEEIQLKFPNYTYPSLIAAIEVSVTNLPPAAQNRYLELAVFPEDAEIPESALEAIWGVDGKTTRRLVSHFVNRSLATRNPTNNRMRVHDLQLDYVRIRARDLRGLHNRMLAAYWQKCGQGWHTGPNDGYFFELLAYHLQQAGRERELQQLLLDFDWIYAKLRATDPVSLLGDYATCPVEGDCHLLASVLTMSAASISTNPAQLSTQLIGRLQRLSDPSEAIRGLLRRACEFEADPALMPVRVQLPSVDQGVHKTVKTSAPILTAALTPDGLLLIAGLADGAVQVWDWRKQILVKTMPGGVGPITTMAIRGQLVAVGGRHDDRSSYTQPKEPVEVWSWISGEFVRSIGADVEDIREGYASVLHDNWMAVTTGAMNNKIHLFDWVTAEMVAVIDPNLGSHGNRPQQAAIIGPYLFYDSNFSDLCIWTVADRKFLGRTSGILWSIPFLAGNRLHLRKESRSSRPASETSFFFRSEEDHKFSEALEIWRYDGSVSAATQSEDRLFLGSDVIDIRDAASGELVDRLEGHSEPISSIHVQEVFIITTSYDQTIRIWDYKARGLNSIDRGTRNPATSSARFYQASISWLGIEGGSVFVGTERGQIQDWDWRTGAIGDSLSVDQPIRALAVNERWLVFSHFWQLKYGQFHVRERNQWTKVPVAPAAHDYRPHRKFNVRNGVFDFDERGVTMAKLCGNSCAVLVENYYTPANSIGGAGFTGSKVYVIDLATQECELSIGEWISAVAISDEFVVGGTLEGNIDIWERASGKFIHQMSDQAAAIVNLEIAGDHLISCSADQTVRVWSTPSFTMVRTIPHLGKVNSLHVRGDLLLTAGDDHRLRLLNWRSGEELAAFTDDASLLACVIGVDMSRVIAGGKSGQLHVLRPNDALWESMRR